MNRKEDVFENLRKLMRELIEMRRRATSGTLPADELSRLSRQISESLDEGNRMLNLDLSIRDEATCTPADIRSLSAAQVFKMVLMRETSKKSTGSNVIF